MYPSFNFYDEGSYDQVAGSEILTNLHSGAELPWSHWCCSLLLTVAFSHSSYHIFERVKCSKVYLYVAAYPVYILYIICINAHGPKWPFA